MRQMISGLVAAAAVMFVGAAPAMACGSTACQTTQVYSGCNTGCQTQVYSGCNTGCGGWDYERLAQPSTQYYYVNQGPTYSGSGAFAPYPTYQEDAVVAPANYGYGHGYSQGYGYSHGYRAAYRRPYYRPYRYGYGPRYGYAHRYAPYYGGHRVLRRYY
jgi:hypothetical protein